jgi:hypothetical protein
MEFWLPGPDGPGICTIDICSGIDDSGLILWNIKTAVSPEYSVPCAYDSLAGPRAVTPRDGDVSRLETGISRGRSIPVEQDGGGYVDHGTRWLPDLASKKTVRQAWLLHFSVSLSRRVDRSVLSGAAMPAQVRRGICGSSVASQNVRPRPTVLATVSNSVKQYKIATVRTDFSSTPQAKAPVAWGLATPLICGVEGITRGVGVGVEEEGKCSQSCLVSRPDQSVLGSVQGVAIGVRKKTDGQADSVQSTGAQKG